MLIFLFSFSRALLRKQLIPFKPSNGEKTLKTNNPDQNSAPKILRFASLPGQNELHIGRVATSTTSASNPSSAIDQSLDKIASSRKRTRESLENSAGRILKSDIWVLKSCFLQLRIFT